MIRAIVFDFGQTPVIDALERLPDIGRIGHLFLLADRETVFGNLPQPREELRVRSHGSLHEREVPIYALGVGPLAVRPRTNADVASWIF